MNIPIKYIFKSTVGWQVFVCHFTTTVSLPIDPKPSDWTVLIAVVVSLGSLGLIAFVIIVIVLCCRHRQQKRKFFAV